MKVGKAIYNILSQSTEVQSNFSFNTTDYSPTGTELVTNGDFSATGTELVTNGDFATNSDWTLNNANITISAGKLNFDNSATNTDFANQTGVAIVGKSYKVVLVVSNLGVGESVKLRYPFQDTSINTNGTHTLYGLAESTAVRITPNSSNATFSIDNISVKELGEGWTLETGWSIGENKAIADTTVNLDMYDDCLATNKNYKISFDVADLQVGGNFLLSDAAFTDIHNITTNGSQVVYLKTTTNTKLNIRGKGYSFNITNISAEEMAVNKIFPELAPTGIDAPYVVYSVVSNSPSDTKNANGDIDTASIEVYGFQDTYNKAVDLGVSVRAALDRKTGTYNTIEIQSTNYVNEQMDVNEARKLWAAIQDYSIRIKNL